ncbi:hypothetical protein GQ457_08G005630 [Hibiscus cannabinus]
MLLYSFLNENPTDQSVPKQVHSHLVTTASFSHSIRLFNALLRCYSVLQSMGCGKKLLRTLQGWKPNKVTFVSVLNACSHGCLVEKGLEFFEKMVSEH